MAAKEPKFSLVQKSGNFEVRDYPAMLIAEVLVTGAMAQASGKGFRAIADFIFGNNISLDGGSLKIDMTVPVVISKRKDDWSFYFVMPSEYSLETLPKPNNSQIKIKNLKNRKCAVLKFSGSVTEEKLNSKTAELISWINSKNLNMTGVAQLARYNPPWTLPFLRRNEIIIEID